MSEPQPLEISVVPNLAIAGALRDELLTLCSRAYQEDFADYFTLLASATHLLARVDGTIVSHVAWVERTLRSETHGVLRTAYVEAVATLPEHQRNGHATALMQMIPALVSDFELAALSPTDAEFYRRLGWEMWEGPLSCFTSSGAELPTPEDEVMIYRLPLTPASLNMKEKLSIDWRPIEIW